MTMPANMTMPAVISPTTSPLSPSPDLPLHQLGPNSNDVQSTHSHSHDDDEEEDEDGNESEEF